MRCGKCRAAYYCSPECQRADWSFHKQCCITGRSSRGDDPRTGFPKTRNSLILEVRQHNDVERLGRVQGVMTNARMRKFFAGMDGTFTVRIQSTNQIVSDNNIPDCSKITVEWVNERPWSSVPPADIELAKGFGMSKSELPSDTNSDSYREEEILFLSPASLAMELLSFQDGKVDPHYKFLEGGLLYLVGEPHCFWSLLIHLRATGKCFPPQPSGQTTWNWRSTWCAAEMLRIMVPLAGHSRSPTSLGGPQAAPLHGASRSMAAVRCADVASNHLAPFFEPVMASGVGDAMMGLPIADDASSYDALMGEGSLPDWWRDLESLWGGVIARAWAEKKAPCMFFNSPMGCSAGARCPAHHCEVFKSQVRRLKGL